jgi:uncharacterized protein YegL
LLPGHEILLNVFVLLRLPEKGIHIFFIIYCKASSGSRPNAAKVVVLVTDGTPDDNVATIIAARTLRASGVTIFAVGVGALINQV